MNKWKFFIKSIITIFVFCIVFSSYVFAEGTDTLLEVVPIVSDKEVSVSVKYTSTNMCGGSFNFIYDAAKLKLINVEETETIKSTTYFINPEFAEEAIRVNWVSTTTMPTEGSLINIKFEMLSETFGKSDISIDKLKVADGDGNKIDAEYNVVYDISDQITPPTDNYTGNNYSPSIPPTTGNSEIKQEPETSITFADIKTTDWFYESVKYVVDNKLMNGISETEFAPNNTLTRAMLVTVLYRNAGEPIVNKSVTFSDINMNSYYANAVIWAKQNGIVNGVTENEFAPDANITREQIAAIIHRYAQYKGYDVSAGENTNILSYDDAESVSEYAVASMQYVVGSGLIKGKTDTTLNPKDNATRAEMAAILQRFIENNK